MEKIKQLPYGNSNVFVGKDKFELKVINNEAIG